MSSILRIKNLKNEFTSSEKKLADYILDNTDKVYNLTTSEIAELSETSPASVIRFSRKLGYSGFRELKIAIAKDTTQVKLQNNNIYEAVTVNDSTDEVIEKIALENIKAIKDTVKLIDKKAINNAIDAIKNAKNINLYGAGESAIVAKDFQYKLVRINMPVTMHMDYHLQLVSAANIGKNDVAIGISHSGKTIETYKALEMSKEKGAKTISITKFGNNPISDISDINIYTTEVEKTLRMGAIASRIAQLTIMDILFICIAKENFVEIPEYIKQTSKILGPFKIK